jgi:hypothetical protein
MFYILEALVTKDTPTTGVVEDLKRRVENDRNKRINLKIDGCYGCYADTEGY